MVGGTRHWLPLLVGHTGYTPPHRRLVDATIDRLPRADALADLVDMTHVRWLLLRPEEYWEDAASRADILRLPEVRIVLARDGWTLARVDRPPRSPRARPTWSSRSSRSAARASADRPPCSTCRSRSYRRGEGRTRNEDPRRKAGHRSRTIARAPGPLARLIVPAGNGRRAARPASRRGRRVASLHGLRGAAARRGLPPPRPRGERERRRRAGVGRSGGGAPGAGTRSRHRRPRDPHLRAAADGDPFAHCLERDGGRSAVEPRVWRAREDSRAVSRVSRRAAGRDPRRAAAAESRPAVSG